MTPLPTLSPTRGEEFTRYFHEYAGFDLERRYGLPFNSFYPPWGEGKGISYPDAHTAIVTDGERAWRTGGYVAAGATYTSTQCPPPLRPKQYRARDVDRRGLAHRSGPNGKDVAKPWTSEVLKRYADLAPDCMGRWLVYWWQNMPGLRNRSRGDAGKPMKNWWVFWFY